MPRAVLNDCSIEIAKFEGLADTPPPVVAGAVAAFVFVGLGVTACVGAGFGVLVGRGVAVGAGVFVGNGVAVGSGVSVGADVGVLVDSGVVVGGTGVEVGGSVGTIVGVGGGVDVPHPANNAIKIISIRQRRSTASMILLAKLFFPAVSRRPLCLRFKNLQSAVRQSALISQHPAPPATLH
jgi:hypothetical protein